MNPRAILLAGSLLAMALGSVHAFSVFIEPLEARFGESRANISLVYSTALIAITIMVSLGGRIYHRAPAWVLSTVLSVVAVFGLALSAMASGLWQVWLGYGVLFGVANGLGYGYALQLSAQAWPGREGLAMGVITAAYALGASVFPVLFDLALAWQGFAGAMVLLAVVLIFVGGLASALFNRTGARFQRTAGEERASLPPTTEIVVLWLAYGLAVTAGLMAIGHATGIAKSLGAAAAGIVAAPVVIALCNMLGSLGGGWLADRVGPVRILTGLAMLSALVLLALGGGAGVSPLAGLGLIGLAYGAVITVTPAMIARRFGVASGVAVYGRVFTAWAVAGLGGPVLAGWLYDRTGVYDIALIVAGCLAAKSGLINMFGPRLFRR